jgi:hypothetical protein
MKPARAVRSLACDSRLARAFVGLKLRGVLSNDTRVDILPTSLPHLTTPTLFPRTLLLQSHGAYSAPFALGADTRLDERLLGPRPLGGRVWPGEGWYS